MNNEQSLWALADTYRGIFTTEQLLELAAIGNVIGYAAQHEIYSEWISFDDLLKDNLNSKKNLKRTLKRIELEIPFLTGVFGELETIDQVDSAQLSRFLYDFYEAAKGIEDFGSWFDAVLLNQSKGKASSGHTSPETLNKIAVSILDPQSGSFYDGVAGLGGGLLAARQHAGNGLHLFGQELNPKALALSIIRLFLHGIESAQLKRGDVLASPAFKEGNEIQRFDYLYMDAPFGTALRDLDAIANDKYQRFGYGVPSKRSADLAFISHALASLNETGRGIVVAIDGTLYRGGADAAIRKNMIASDVIEAVISLPARLYERTVLPVNLLVFNKDKKPERRGKILFVNAVDRFTEGQRTKRFLSDEDILEIQQTVSSGQEIKEFSKWIDSKTIRDGNLLPSRYLVASEMDIPGHGNVKVFKDKLDDVKTIALQDKASFFTGFNVVSKNKESDKGRFRIVRISDVQDGKLVLSTIARYDIDNNAKVEKYRLEAGDIILSIRGQALKTAVIPENEEDLLLSQNFIGIRCGNGLHPEFLKAYLDSPVAQFLLTSKLSGTTVPTLSRKDVEALEIPDLTLAQQQTAIDEFTSSQRDIEQRIEELQLELKRVKAKVYEQMGIGEAFELTD